MQNPISLCRECLMTSGTDVVITAAMTLNEIALVVPRAVEVFARHGLDACCGGAKPLVLVCDKHGLDLEAMLGELHAL
jgi:iron-sulfur cluster repair protein YtfE (RIC family)